MRPLCNLITILILQFPALVCSGQYYFKNYQTNNGLAHNSVRSIIQDSKGLIWVGTRGGLNRFDGYTFKICKNENNEFGNIGNNVVTVIAEDKKGMLWVGTEKGVYKYDPYKEAFLPIEIAPQKYIDDLIIDKENNLWLIANSSLYKYNQKKHIITDYRMPVSCIALDKEMNLWTGNRNGEVNIYDSDDRLIKRAKIIHKSIPQNLRSVSVIFPIDKNQALIGCFGQGLKHINTRTNQNETLNLTSNNKDIFVRDITSDGHNYWIATEGGIYIYDLETKTSQNLQKKADDPYAIADNAVYTICKDNEGGMWAGTFFGGISYFSKENARFKKYYPLLGVNSISGSAVREICADNDGNLWIGTEDAGVNKLDTQTGKFTRYNATGKAGDISYPNIHGLLALKNQLLIGPFHRGLEIMDIRTGSITERLKSVGERNDITNDFIISIYRTRDNTILMGTAYDVKSGLFSYNVQKKTFNRIEQIPKNTYVFTICEDANGFIWAGSMSEGVFYYHPKTGQKGKIRFGDKIKNKLVNEFPVYGILEDSKRSLWFTTEGGGLIKVSPDRKILKKYTTKNGLPTNVLYRVLEDDSERLWISSLKGLICFDMQTETFKTYTQSNGLITDQFNFNSAYKDKNGQLFFGSIKGMISFNPKEFTQTDVNPPTYITGFQINNEEMIPGTSASPLNKSILYTDTIILKHNQNNFSIEFAALNYSSPDVTRYEFLMQGLDINLTYLSSNRKAYFTDLSPGKYTFIVRAKSNINSWTGKERSLYIEIKPPFWKSSIAYFLYLLIVSITLYLSIRYYHRHLERKNMNRLQLFEHEKEKEIYQSKIEFFTNIAHEIQTPLTLILGPLERIIKKTKEQENIKKNLLMIEKNAKRLEDLTGQLLDFRKTEIHQFGLNFVNTNISKLLKDQIIAFKQEAEKSNITLKLEVPKDDVVAFVDTEAMTKICSNLISNAIKYSESKAIITLAANKADEQFIIKFLNDGKGIPHEFRDKIFEPFFRLPNKNKPGTGIGLSLAKSLTELHNGSLSLIPSDNNMVVFELALPIHQTIEFNLSSWKKIK